MNDCCTRLTNVSDHIRSPEVIQGTLISFLRQFWSNPDNMELPDMRQHVWREDESQSGILIDDIASRVNNFAQKRPAVLLKGGSLERKELLLRSRELRVDIWHGRMTLFCLGANPGQTNHVATTVFTLLNAFKDNIRQALCCHDFSVTGRGELGVLKEANDAFIIPVLIEYEYELAWTVVEEGPGLRKLRLRLDMTPDRTR
jgi:hypothetical protein